MSSADLAVIDRLLAKLDQWRHWEQLDRLTNSPYLPEKKILYPSRLDPTLRGVAKSKARAMIEEQARSEQFLLELDADGRAVAQLADRLEIKSKHLLSFITDCNYRTAESARRARLCVERVRNRLLAEESPAEGIPSEGADGKPGKRGRKRRYNQQKDEEMANKWERANDAGVEKKAFCRDLNLTLREFNNLLSRVRMYKRRAKKGRAKTGMRQSKDAGVAKKDFGKDSNQKDILHELRLNRNRANK